MNQKTIAGAVIGAAAAIGVAVTALTANSKPATAQVEVRISDPAAREAFLKIKNPTPQQIRMAEDN